MKLMPITRKCPMCEKEITLQFTEKTVNEAENYQNTGLLLQEAMPVDEFEDYHCKAIVREFAKSGYCPDCQSMLFGGPKENYRKVLAFGK